MHVVTLELALFVLLLLCSAMCCFFAAYIAVFGSKLLGYLRKNKYERWLELTTVCNIPGGMNYPKIRDYIYSDVDNDDELVLKYKNIMKKALARFVYSVIVLCAIICLMIIIHMPLSIDL